MKMGPSGERCSRCYFFKPENIEDDMEDGFCCRYPPSVLIADEEHMPMIPITVHGDSWCGEYKPYNPNDR